MATRDAEDDVRPGGDTWLSDAFHHGGSGGKSSAQGPWNLPTWVKEDERGATVLSMAPLQLSGPPSSARRSMGSPYDDEARRRAVR